MYTDESFYKKTLQYRQKKHIAATSNKRQQISLNMKIAVAGTGYVGLSIATLLAQHNEVVAVDIIPEKVDKINNRTSPIQDDYIERFLAEKELNLRATLDGKEAYKDADFIVIAAPTNYDPQKNFFDTHHIEDVIDLILEVNPQATMVIKSGQYGPYISHNGKNYRLPKGAKIESLTYVDCQRIVAKTKK